MHLRAHDAAEAQLQQQARAGVRSDFFLDPIENFLDQQRHRHQHGWLQRPEVLGDGPQALDKIHTAAAADRHQEIGGEGKGVKQRQDHEKPVFAAQIGNDGEATFDIRAEIGVREHCAFGLARGAGGVDQ